MTSHFNPATPKPPMTTRIVCEMGGDDYEPDEEIIITCSERILTQRAFEIAKIVLQGRRVVGLSREDV